MKKLKGLLDRLKVHNPKPHVGHLLVTSGFHFDISHSDRQAQTHEADQETKAEKGNSHLLKVTDQHRPGRLPWPSGAFPGNVRVPDVVFVYVTTPEVSNTTPSSGPMPWPQNW